MARVTFTPHLRRFFPTLQSLEEVPGATVRTGFSTRMRLITAMARAAVPTSTRKAEARPAVAISTPLTGGASSMSTEPTVWFRPCTLVSFSLGTSCGYRALTAGVCTPAPSERTADTTSKSSSPA